MRRLAPLLPLLAAVAIAGEATIPVDELVGRYPLLGVAVKYDHPQRGVVDFTADTTLQVATEPVEGHPACRLGELWFVFSFPTPKGKTIGVGVAVNRDGNTFHGVCERVKSTTRVHGSFSRTADGQTSIAGVLEVIGMDERKFRHEMQFEGTTGE